ncbi:hypothetical protein B0J14DRAFT_605224 [Halenospora varia]|nr:hypothetical protein B0J14DRAFT_605224 [Halenospora varia]
MRFSTLLAGILAAFAISALCVPVSEVEVTRVIAMTAMPRITIPPNMLSLTPTITMVTSRGSVYPTVTRVGWVPASTDPADTEEVPKDSLGPANNTPKSPKMIGRLPFGWFVFFMVLAGIFGFVLIVSICMTIYHVSRYGWKSYLQMWRNSPLCRCGSPKQRTEGRRLGGPDDVEAALRNLDSEQAASNLRLVNV